MAFVDKLSENPVLTQKIAENINSHLLKQQHDAVNSCPDVSGVSRAVSSSVTRVSSTATVVTASSAATASVNVVSSCNKSTTSTADLSINEDSLMSALEVLVTLPSNSFLNLPTSVVWLDSLVVRVLDSVVTRSQV